MIIARTREELAEARSQAGGTLAFVPTMGALHEGHRSLIRQARGLADSVAVSIFVNPLQFGPGEDFDRYPRTFATDVEACAAEGADLVFAPDRDVMYPDEPQVTVRSGPMGEVVEGAARPGHFDGMLTVVLKLLNLVRPDVAIFGEKDAQQLAMIRRMVADLDVPVRIVGGATVREPDGLALSSRNRYLSAAERRTALALSRALRAGADAAPAGPDAVLASAGTVLDKAAAADPPLDLDYLVLVDPSTFAPVTPSHTGPAVLAVAGRVGATHLIDNVSLHLGKER
ncbi:pantoate--beta-alanine ligase [Actinomadura madurae]|uniref:pantoate--beta-alanine ligase n=1 Tax=Actinomadura madurae TaxID=1993 RepID=UPI00202764AB|nr:pantoate--beta-alanine ligase [Actinomadura madurae]MCP9969536.1 pantoate--beta-alanine ligase [Actinomadura madurae]MCP9981990.1 pantoate--beta-alanine ligase [Actinomadura madurae]URM98266.1 pantoate--beta-alanine ligase [Actinomadura madurae]